MSLTLDPDDTSRRIHELVWGGFHPADDIWWLITDEYLDPDELNDEDIAWVKANAADATTRKLADEKSWPVQTEYDRLEAVFCELRKEPLIALHRAGNTRSEGLEDVRELFLAEGGIDSGIVGYCFYHSQDVDSVVASGRLWLSFGAIGKKSDGQREEKNIAVAKRILGVLGAAGFEASWSGDAGERIEVSIGQWRKRSPAE